VSDYRLDDRDSISAETKDFSSRLCVQTGSEAHPASYTMGTEDPFLGGKGRLRREADASAEVKKE
jgi:hypothetical protein